MANSNNFYDIIAADDLKKIKSYYRFSRKPTEMDVLAAIAYNANTCLDYMLPKFLKTRPYLTIDLIQAAAGFNRIDVLKRLVDHPEWDDHYHIAWGLDVHNCPQQAIDFLLNRWDDTEVAIDWSPEPGVWSNPKSFPAREDGPFTVAALGSNSKNLDRLAKIVQNKPYTRNLVVEQILHTTRRHYSGKNFDEAMTHPLLIQAMFANNNPAALQILEKSIQLTFPTPLNVLATTPLLKNVLSSNFSAIVEVFINAPTLLLGPDGSRLRFENTLNTLHQTNPHEFAKLWVEEYLRDPTNDSHSPRIDTINMFFAVNVPHAIDLLLERAQGNALWDSTTEFGALVTQRAINASLGTVITSTKRQRKM